MRSWKLTMLWVSIIAAFSACIEVAGFSFASNILVLSFLTIGLEAVLLAINRHSGPLGSGGGCHGSKSYCSDFGLLSSAFREPKCGEKKKNFCILVLDYKAKISYTIFKSRFSKSRFGIIRGGGVLFIGRKAELDFLNSKYSEPQGQLIVLYGRRRVGKTEILREFCKSLRR